MTNRSLQISVDLLNGVSMLLHFLENNTILSADGEIINHELHSPFTYLLSLQQGLGASTKSSRQVSLGALVPNVTNWPADDVGEFLSMLRFEQRERLKELPVDFDAARKFESP